MPPSKEKNKKKNIRNTVFSIRRRDLFFSSAGKPEVNYENGNRLGLGLQMTT